MDNAIVERALRALAEIGAARPATPELLREMPELANPALATKQKIVNKPEDHFRGLAPCGSSECAGCYEVDDGRRIHPPKCGEEYRVWLEHWEAIGRVQ